MDSANNLQENPGKFSDGERTEQSTHKVQAKPSNKTEQSKIENNTQTGAVFVHDNSKSDCSSSIVGIERSTNLAIFSQNNDQEAVFVSALQEISSYKKLDIPTKENRQMNGISSDSLHENPSKPTNAELTESSKNDALCATAQSTEESATEINIQTDAGFNEDESKCNCILSIDIIEKDTIEAKAPTTEIQNNDQESHLVTDLQEEDGDLASDISANENLRMNHTENFMNSLEENPRKSLNEEVIKGSEYEILAESSKKADESTIEKNTQIDAVFEQDGSKSQISPIEDADTAIDETCNLSCKIERNLGTSTDASLEGENFVVNNNMHFDKPAVIPELLVDNCESKRVMQSTAEDNDNMLKESICESNSFQHMNTKVMHENDRVLHDAEQNQNKAERTMAQIEDNPPKTLRIVLIGQTGVGKSSTGNTLLGEKRFKSSPSSKSCTQVCQRETTVKQGFILEVLDTPGLFDTHKPADELRKEFLNCMVMTNPGPHAFLLILKMNRITEQEKRTLKSLKEIFGGDHFLRHTIIVITRKEDLTDSYSKAEGETDKNLDLDFLFKSTLEKSPDLFHMVSQCENRYYLLSNKGKVDGISRSQQAIQLVSLINEMTLKNGDTFYSYQYFVSLEEERKLQVRKEQEKKEKKRRLKREMKQREELARLREQELELKLEKAQIKREEEQRRAKREKARLEAELREELLEKERLKRERENQEQERRLKVLEAEVRRKERYRERRWEILEESRSRVRSASPSTSPSTSSSTSSDNWTCIVM